MRQGTIVKVAGPLVVAEGMTEAGMADVVQVGEAGLIGEILNMTGDRASIQVYEETGGLAPGAPVRTTGAPLSAELGPGMIGTIYDGIQRPLLALMEQTGSNLERGVSAAALPRDKKWKFQPAVQKGARVESGDVLGTVQETAAVEHRILVPAGVAGTVKTIAAEGEYTVEDTIAVIDTGTGEKTLSMLQRWPVRRGRPYRRKLAPRAPLATGQRIIDALFPIAKGGTAAVPGPFGSGKTVVQHQIAKWADVDIVVYIGCGERGNEMTDVLREFPALTDPRTGRSLMERTVLIANTSDMPVAAREASVYTGITIAEYFRDMGYDVAVIADSTSRWAEALREMSGRLEEMPGEEGYPAYLSSRLAQFYERAGVVETLGAVPRRGSLTAVGAVSPPGGDLSEPVAQGTMRIVKVFWSLDAQLAYRRHFPAIHWLRSYSLYVSSLEPWYREHLEGDFPALRQRALELLQQEDTLQEVVRLVGQDALSGADRLTLETAKMLREDFLQQNAFVSEDAYTPLAQQARLLELILCYDTLCRAAIEQGNAAQALFALPVRETLARAKMAPGEEWAQQYAALERQMRQQIAEQTREEELTL